MLLFTDCQRRGEWLIVLAECRDASLLFFVPFLELCGLVSEAYRSGCQLFCVT